MSTNDKFAFACMLLAALTFMVGVFLVLVGGVALASMRAFVYGATLVGAAVLLWLCANLALRGD